jgi:hypothetical protein
MNFSPFTNKYKNNYADPVSSVVSEVLNISKATIFIDSQQNLINSHGCQ